MIIYRAINLTNGKTYIGKTITPLLTRKKRHLYDAKKGSGYLFHMAIRKYGDDGFAWDVIDNCLFAESLPDLERYYIKLYNSKSPFGYNLTDGGEGLFNPTADVRNRISLSNKGKHNHSAKTLKKISAGSKGRKLTDEQREHLSKINRGENHPRFGRHHSEETKKKMSDAHRGRKHGPLSKETKIKLSISSSHPSAEAREKMSIAAREYWRQKHEIERQIGK
jgi:group I intron endonuclease